MTSFRLDSTRGARAILQRLTGWAGRGKRGVDLIQSLAPGRRSMANLGLSSVRREPLSVCGTIRPLAGVHVRTP